MAENVAVLKEPLKHVLVVDDDPSMGVLFRRLAENVGCACSVATTGTEAMDVLALQTIDLVILDLNLPGISGLELLEQIRKRRKETDVIIITGQATVQSAIQSLKMGAYDYLTKPFEDIGRIARMLENVLQKRTLERRLHSYEKQRGELQEFAGLIGRSLEMQKVYRLIESISHSNSNVLITGESGTGKELVARAIHDDSPRQQKPFVVINCSALAENLLESELFGHVKGAYTGAIQEKKGLFAEADGGTIFLDEIGEVSPSVQVKLLRVLQDGEIRPLGADRVQHVSVRVIAATNRDLHEAMKQGLFREDLFYRLNVIGIYLPPLRDRREDIPLLAYHFLNKYANRTGIKPLKISVDAMQSLQGYRWIGNVRELENVIERAVVLSDGEALTARDLPPRLLREVFYQKDKDDGVSDWMSLPYRDAKEKALIEFNHKYIGGLLQLTEGNISLASQRAVMDRNNFKKIIKRYNVNVKAYKKN